MKLRNTFSIPTRYLFFERRYECADCGGNGQGVGGIELHHIVGRSSNSPLNAVPLCKECHASVGHTDEEHIRFFGWNLKHLLGREDYQLVKRDEEFIEEHKRLFNKIIET